MCPTGWFIPTADGPDYMNETLGEVHVMGELKVDGRSAPPRSSTPRTCASSARSKRQLAAGGLDER